MTATHLTEFVIWLPHPGRAYPHKNLLTGAQSLSASSINLIVQEVADLYRFLVRRGLIAQSPVVYIAASRGKWAIEGDLLVIAALRRRLDEMKQQLAAKDQELRGKQREIDRLYGKLAGASQLTDPEIRSALVTALERLATGEANTRFSSS